MTPEPEARVPSPSVRDCHRRSNTSIYIVKENRTYDQVLGDMKEGNGDASLVLFGEQVTPNHHKLAREFVLLDNFYVNSDVSADGHNWSTAAHRFRLRAKDVAQQLCAPAQALRLRRPRGHRRSPGRLPLDQRPSRGDFDAKLWVLRQQSQDHPPRTRHRLKAVRDAVLGPVTNRQYRGFDLDYPDVERAKVFLEDLAEFEKNGQMPRLIFMRLGNDHTNGSTPGKKAPLSLAADNDYALGMIVEGVSHSGLWPKTAIFVLEDDAQNGPDHVDSHRSGAFVLSPYARRRAVDSSMYNTTSMLRTMELILGLNPMTQFDAGARPMHASFQAAPDLAPYTAEKPRIALDERNPAASPTAARSSRLDFSEEDLADDNELNDILWLAVRGSPAPPAPTRSYFAR